MITLQQLVSEESPIHWILGGSSTVALIGAAVSFGMMKADRKNDRNALEDHSEMDDRRFSSMDKKLIEISNDTKAIRSWIDQQIGYQKGLKEAE